jgi:hypothetical protein
MTDQSVEQQARELLESMGVEQYLSAGDIVPLANLIEEIERLRHQIHFIQDMILRHKAEQTADPRCMCSEMDANLWAWAEDREGDLPVRQSNNPPT